MLYLREGLFIMIDIFIKKLNSQAVIPEYQTEDSSGMDLCACIGEDILIKRGGFKKIPSGIALSIPKGYEAQIRPRSGLALKYGVTLLNSPGTIDSDYRGEICVILINHGKETFQVKNGDRIAQLVFASVTTVKLKEVSSLDETKRNTGGFGHTGI